MIDQVTKDEGDRSLQLAQTIAREAVARVEEEFADSGARNAALLTILGYMAGVGDRMLEEHRGMGSITARLLFEQSKCLGHMVAAAPVDLADML